VRFWGTQSPTLRSVTMKLIAFMLLTLAGTGAGLVIGLVSMSSKPVYRQHEFLVGNVIGGAVAGMVAGAIASRFAGGSSKKD